jgi:hypothetical protein
MKKHFPIILVVLCASIATLWILYQSKKSHHSDTIEMSQEDKNAIIEQALNLELPPSNTIISEEAHAVNKEATRKVHEGNYEEAIAITVSGLKKFPKDFTLQSDLAALLGDCSEMTPAPLKDAMVYRSKAMFDRLLKEVDDQPKSAFYSFKNEYYFRFAQYREQYELGLMRVAEYWGTHEWASRGFNGYYSQGVGAAHYAKKLLEQRDKSRALDYAQKAVVAWAQYFSYENNYYNSYVHYALALGILGYKEEMLRALERSASLINRDLSYHEFEEVISFIEKIQ